MKTLALANQKGGVGKSAVACQLAYHLAQRGLRVLLLDLDHQGNSSGALRRGGIATVSETGASAALTHPDARVEAGELVVMPADGEALRGLERRVDEHNGFVNSLAAFLERAPFDVAIVDTNPNPDIRQLAALVTATHVLSPVELTQESVDGIGALLHDPALGIRRIQAALRPDLVLLGILPNKVDPTPFQRANLRDLASAYGELMIPVGDGFAAIRRSTAIVEAQSAGVPLWAVGRGEPGGVKTSAREAWRQVRPVFERIAELMEIPTDEA